MASLLIKDRIDANDMDTGKPLKDTADLRIEDFVPTAAEKDYIFQQDPVHQGQDHARHRGPALPPPPSQLITTLVKNRLLALPKLRRGKVVENNNEKKDDVKMK